MEVCRTNGLFWLFSKRGSPTDRKHQPHFHSIIIAVVTYVPYDEAVDMLRQGVARLGDVREVRKPPLYIRNIQSSSSSSSSSSM